jgi:hypothetical protein
MATPYFSTVLLVVASIALFGLAVYNYHATLGLSFEEKNLKDFVTNRVIPQISKDLNSISHQFGEGNIASNVASNVVSNTIGNGNGVPILNTVPAQGLGNPLDSTSSLQSNIKSNLEVPKPHVLQCEHADLVTFWRDPTLADQMYETPYKTNGPTKYVTFEPDVGGWNNIRMQMELVLVFAAATGRTLVLPPDQPMYLLNKGKGHQKEHSFADFFPFDFIKKRVPVITMKEFMSTEAITGRLLHKETKVPTKPPGGRTEFIGTNRDDRNLMWEYLRNVTSCPPWKGMRDFLVIPPRPGLNTSLLPSAEAGDYDKRMNTFAGDKRYGMERHAQFYDTYWHDQHVIHFISKPAWGYRLLEHFYTYIHFQDEAMDRYYKRFVRDFVHYVDLIFCKAAKIMHKLREEGGGKYSAFHVRRGEFQYKVCFSIFNTYHQLFSYYHILLHILTYSLPSLKTECQDSCGRDVGKCRTVHPIRSLGLCGHRREEEVFLRCIQNEMVQRKVSRRLYGLCRIALH